MNRGGAEVEARGLCKNAAVGRWYLRFSFGACVLAVGMLTGGVGSAVAVADPGGSPAHHDAGANDSGRNGTARGPSDGHLAGDNQRQPGDRLRSTLGLGRAETKPHQSGFSLNPGMNAKAGEPLTRVLRANDNGQPPHPGIVVAVAPVVVAVPPVVVAVAPALASNPFVAVPVPGALGNDNGLPNFHFPTIPYRSLLSDPLLAAYIPITVGQGPVGDTSGHAGDGPFLGGANPPVLAAPPVAALLLPEVPPVAGAPRPPVGVNPAGIAERAGRGLTEPAPGATPPMRGESQTLALEPRPASVGGHSIAYLRTIIGDLRTAALSQLAKDALPGLGTILLLTVGGVLIRNRPTTGRRGGLPNHS